MTDAERLAEHEAAHAAAAIALGIPVLSADAVGDEHHAGMVRAAYPDTPEGARTRAQVVLAGLVQTADVPAWPPRTDRSTDERNLRDLADELQLDEDGYRGIVDDTLELTAGREYALLHAALSHALERHGRLDEHGIQLIKAIAEGTTMQTKRFELTDATVLGEGEMVALASTYNVDLQGDRVIPGAFAAAVAQIQAGRTLPLIWGHDANGSPQNFIGRIVDADETREGLEVRARFDLEDPVGAKAWRLVRDGDIDRLSIGYRIPAGGQRRGKDGANELHRVDLREVSLVFTPANDQARVLAVKRADDLARLRDEWRDRMLTLLGRNDGKGDPLRAKAARLERECAPVQTAVFDA